MRQLSLLLCLYIILLPGYGGRGVCWEPYAPDARESTGPRLALNVFPSRSSQRALGWALGDYRWSLAKAEAGLHWKNKGFESKT